MPWTSSEEDGRNIPCESLARRAKMPHPLGDAWVLEWKLRIWLDTRFIIVGDLMDSRSMEWIMLARSRSRSIELER